MLRTVSWGLLGRVPRPGKERCVHAARLSSRAMSDRPSVLVITGPTGVGKSAIAELIATTGGLKNGVGEIISADSAQVYRGLEIGTAKPSRHEQAAVRHHLVDVCSFETQFHAGDFVKLATEAIDDVIARGNTPIIVGGTAFYLRNLIEGLPGTPETDPEVALAVEEELRGMSWPEALSVLSDVDRPYAQTIAENDWRRLERALNIVKVSGRPVSSFKGTASERYDYRCVYITAPRLNLFSRIDSRCEQMIQRGLVEEVIGLLDQGLDQRMPAAGVLGYKQTLAYLRDEWLTRRTRSASRHSRAFSRYLDSFQAATRQFARKQASWFRNHESHFVWFSQNMDIDGVVHDVDLSAAMISERFSAPTWQLPTAAECSVRAKADQDMVAQADMAKYKPLNLIYDSPVAVQTKIDDIRERLITYDLLPAHAE